MAAMEEVLDLHAKPCDPQRPLVCFDETSTPSCWPTSGNRCRHSRGGRGVRTTDTRGRARATCS